MTTRRVNGNIRHLDEDITNCEKFLCKVLNTKAERPAKNSTKVIENRNKVANNKTAHPPFLSCAASSQISRGATSQTRGKSQSRRTSPDPLNIKQNKVPLPKNLINTQPEKKLLANPSRRNNGKSESGSSSKSRSSSKDAREKLEPDHLQNVVKTETSKQHQLDPRHSGVSWSKALTYASNTTMASGKHLPDYSFGCSTFSQFDPMRTLHFLTKELQSQLHVALPKEKNLHRIVLEIQQSLRRLPTYSRTDLLYDAHQEVVKVNYMASQTYAAPVLHRSSQTDDTLDSDMGQKILQVSCTKLEESCKVLEQACRIANDERDQTLEELNAEKQKTVILKNENDELQMKLKHSTEQSNSRTTKIFQDLEKQCQKISGERDAIQTQLNECKEHDDVTGFISVLQDETKKLEKEKSAANNKVVMLKLEQEKLTILLSARDKQLVDLKQELSSIQGLVATQLSELQQSSGQDHVGFLSSSSATSLTTIGASPSGQITNSRAMSITEVWGPQGDRTTVKDIFADIRKQIVMNIDVTLPPPPDQYQFPLNASSSQHSQWSD